MDKLMKDSIENKPDPNKLLDWYDYNARALPWRVPPPKRLKGVLPNPYHVWLSEIMLQQTRVDQGLPYYNRFIQRFERLDSLQPSNGMGYEGGILGESL